MAMYDTKEEFLDAEKAIKCFPVINVESSYFVEGEKDIAIGDILTIKLVITHLNLEEKQ